MHHRISTALRTLRQDLALTISDEAVERACRRIGHRWRERVLGPAAVVRWFLLQILLGNTAVEHVTLLADRRFSASAYCRARRRLPIGVPQALLEGLAAACGPDIDDATWRGRRTFLVDGSSFNTPDTPELRRHFGLAGNQKPGCAFPTVKILALFHAGTGMLMRVVAMPHRDGEVSRLNEIHQALRPGDVLVGDRGFCSFAHVAALASAGIDVMFRVNTRRIIDFTPGRPHAHPGDDSAKAKGLPRSRWLRALGGSDQIVEWLKPARQAPWMSAADHAVLPESVAVRELRYRVECRGFRTQTVIVVTTLLDAEAFPAEALAELNGARWRVEQDLRDLKQTMGMDTLKCKSVEGVLKELIAYAIVYNLVRAVIGEAARRQGVPIDRISFIDALRWLRARVGWVNDWLPRLVTVPFRPGRVEPRAVKRRPKPFPRLTKPRAEMRKDLMRQWDTP